jgi:hypothetical protein
MRADALGQVGDHVLAQASISAGCAGLGAFKTGLDAGGQFFLVDPAKILRVGIEHGRYMVCHWVLLIHGAAGHGPAAWLIARRWAATSVAQAHRSGQIQLLRLPTGQRKYSAGLRPAD